LLRLVARALGSAAAAAEPLVSHALHLLLYGLQVAAPNGGDAAQGAPRFLALLCDEEAFAPQLAPPDGAGGASLVAALARLSHSSSLPPPCKASAEHALRLAARASAGCALARERAKVAARERAADAQAAPGKGTADRDERRKQAKAGRARMMQRMAAAQEAFAGGGAGVDAAADDAGVAAGELTPASRALLARRERERQGLGALLGDDEACCVLCKERLAGEDAAAAPPACGLIARVCAQRLPLAAGVRAKQEAVVAALAHGARGGAEALGTDALRAAAAAATSEEGGAEAADDTAPRSTGKKRAREGRGEGASGEGISGLQSRVEACASAVDAIESQVGRTVRERREGGAAPGLSQRRRTLESEEGRMLLEAGVPEAEILAGLMGAEEDGESGDDEMEVEGEEGEEEESSGEEPEDESEGEGGPTSREMRNRRRMRQAMEQQMSSVLDLMIERNAASADSAPAGAPARPATRSGAAAAGAVEEEGEEEMDDLEEEEEEGMSDDEGLLGYRSELLRETESQLLQLLNGEVDDGGLANGGAGLDSHLTMLMNDDESDFDSDSDEADRLRDMLESVGPGASAAVMGGASAARALRASTAWPLPHLAAPSGSGESEEEAALRHEGALFSSSSPGALLTTCGHATHVACWHEYMTGLLRRVMQSEGFEGEGLVKPQRGEFVCPVCRRAANALMPLAPCEPCDASPPPEEEDAAAGARAWARRAALLAPSQEPVASHEVRSTIEHFSVTCATVHGALPRLSIPTDDARVELMPIALLAHNAAVAELTSRAAAAQGAAAAPQSDAEVATASLKLRVLWQLARASKRQLSRSSRTLLGCLGAEAAPPDTALAALLCAEPFALFVDLLVLHGVSHAKHAAACALAASMAQTIAGAAALGTRAEPPAEPAAEPAGEGVPTADEWASRLELMRAALDAGAVGELLHTHCAELLWRMRHLVAVLRGEVPLSAPPADAAQTSRVAAECLAELGVADAPALLLPLALSALDALRSRAAELWAHGAAAFAAARLSDATAAATRREPPSPRLLAATLAGWPSLPPAPVGLVPLPASFEAFFHDNSSHRCADCRATPENRAVCLACGTTLCGLDTPHGSRAVVEHATSCGVGVGLFMLTNNSAVVLVRERRLVFVGSPYRDAHGEVDIGLLRGKPLTLHPAGYATLSKHWLNLAFDETARSEEELPLGL